MGRWGWLSNAQFLTVRSDGNQPRLYFYCAACEHEYQDLRLHGLTDSDNVLERFNYSKKGLRLILKQIREHIEARHPRATNDERMWEHIEDDVKTWWNRFHNQWAGQLEERARETQTEFEDFL